MSTITILHKDSPLIASFIEAGTTITAVMVNHVISSWTLKDVQTRTDLDPELVASVIDPEISTEENAIPAPIVFDPAIDAIQQLSSHNFKELRKQQGILFPAPVVEPAPEPRYKTHMTGSEFSRDLLKPEEWEAIELLAQTDTKVAAWRNITISGGVWTEHEDFEAGIQLAGSLGVWGEGAAKAARMEEIKRGLLIV